MNSVATVIKKLMKGMRKVTLVPKSRQNTEKRKFSLSEKSLNEHRFGIEVNVKEGRTSWQSRHFENLKKFPK